MERNTYSMMDERAEAMNLTGQLHIKQGSIINVYLSTNM